MLYYLNDSAARPQGDLPWSSIEISARRTRLNHAFLNPASHLQKPLQLYAYALILHVCDWAISEMHDSTAWGELRNGAKTKAGPLEAEQLSRLGKIALVR